MKKTILLHVQKLLFTILILFFVNNIYAASRPVADAVVQKHDLNINFRSYNLFLNAHELTNANYRVALSTGTVANLNQGKLNDLIQLSPAAITVNIPFNGGVIAVELVSVNILTPDFTIRTNENKTVAYTPGKYYRGIIKGNMNSLAAFSFFNNEFYGVISDDINGNIVVGKTLYPGNINEYIIYSDKNLKHSSSGFCKTSEDTKDIKKLQQLTTSLSGTTTNCAKLYYEIDNDIFLNSNSSVINTANWMTAVHNSVATLFANDNISVALNEIFIWTTADPYNGADATEQLALFKSTRPIFNGDAGQLVAIDFNNGGISAQVNSLCTNQNYSYSDIDYGFSALPTYSWTIESITHEFGHVFGSHHTHWCGWLGGAIDNCDTPEGVCPPGPAPVGGGTIMSNCNLTLDGINFNKGFGPLPAAAIQNGINNAPCLGTTCVLCPASPNNECATPDILTINTNCIYISGTLCGATQSITPVTCNGRTATHAYDNWFSLIPEQNAIVIKCTAAATTDLVIALYSGTCGSPTLLYCSDSTTNGGTERIFATVSAGTTYFLRIYDFNGKTTGTDFAICVTQACVTVTNDECANAKILNISSSCNYVNGELCSATQSLPPDTCSGFTSTDAFDLFYKIIPTQSNVRITCKSGLTTDMVLILYSGTCGSLNIITCSDTTTSGGIETIDVFLTPGTTYYIRVYDWNGNFNGTDFQICAQYIQCIPPDAPTGINTSSDTICAGTSTTLDVLGTLTPGATWTWYSSSCGGTPAGTGNSISVFPLTTTTYYVRAESSGCNSNCSSVTVTVNSVPSAPTSANATPSSLCTSASSILSVAGTLSAGASWHWYSGTCGGTPEGTGVSLSVSPSSTTSYFVRAENASCFSACVNKSVSVTTTPSNPVSATGTSPICSGKNSTLQVNGTLSAGAVWHWYSNSCGGTAVGTGTSIIVSPSANTTYYVRAENNLCFSNCSSFTVNVNPTPAAPVAAAASPISICSAGSSTTLSLTGTLSAGATWHWYSGTCGGASAGTGASLSLSPTTSTTYFVRAETATCLSACVSTNVSVATTPSDPVSATGSSPICSGKNSTLQVNGALSAGATWHWYSNSCGGTTVGTGSSIIVSPSANTTYFVRAENNSCFSNCSSVTINVNPTPAAPASASASPVFLCSAGASSTLSLTGTLSTGATWHWYSGTCGGTAVGAGVSLSVTPSSTTSYFVRSENGTCSSACLNAVVNIASIPNDPVSATATSPVCSGTNSSLNVSGVLSTGATWHWYSVSCGGTVAGTGASISVTPASNTTYFVRAENGNCYSNCTSVSVVVNASPTAPISVDALPSLLCVSGPSTLTVTGNLSSGATWKWYSGSCGGTPAGTGTSIIVTPSSTTNYFVRAENGCSSPCLNTVVTVSSIPGNPDSAKAVSPVCSGTNSTLQASGTLSSGASWRWYSGSCGGMVEGTGTSINVSPQVNTTYYVRSENGICFSNCVSTSVNVIASPSDPLPISSSSTDICAGNSAFLWETGTLSPGSNWHWFSDSCGGLPLGLGDSILITPDTNETYYVRAEDSICPSNCLSININVNAPPLQPVIIINNGVLSVSTFASYKWYESIDRTIFNVIGNGQQQAAIISGYYFVIVTDSNGCKAFSDTILFQTDFISEKNTSALISIYPNPVNDLLNINFKTVLKENALLKIFDNTGRLIYSCRIIDGKTNIISLASWSSGLYQFLFSIDDKLFERKVLKQ